MPAWNSTVHLSGGAISVSEVLWENFRNGLAHALGVQDAALDYLPGLARFATGPHGLLVDPAKCFADFETGLIGMMGRVRNDPAVRSIFIARFRENFPY